MPVPSQTEGEREREGEKTCQPWSFEACVLVP